MVKKRREHSTDEDSVKTSRSASRKRSTNRVSQVQGEPSDPTSSDSTKAAPHSGHHPGTEHFVHDLRDYGLEINERIYIWLHTKVGQLSKTWVTHTLLLLAMVLYALLGGLVFQLAEGNDNEVEIKYIFETRPKLLNVLESERTKHGGYFDTQREIDDFFGNLTKGFQVYEKEVLNNFIHNSKMDRGKDELNWAFWSTVFFCCTVFTTIGYGHMFPVTTLGQVLCMIYAIIGIPLFLIVLTDFGFVLKRVIKFLWMIFRRIYYTGSLRKEREPDSSDEDMEAGLNDEDRQNIDADEEAVSLPVTLCLVFFITYILFGSILFFLWENWTFFESFYFLFISMTTLGLGDFVPKNQQNMMFSIVFMGFGLALSSMCISVVRERLVESMIEASAKIGERYGIDIEVDHDLVEDPGEKKERKLSI